MSSEVDGEKFRETVAAIVSAMPGSKVVPAEGDTPMQLEILAPSHEEAEMIRIVVEGLAYVALSPAEAKHALLVVMPRKLYRAVGFPIDEFGAQVERIIDGHKNH